MAGPIVVDIASGPTDQAELAAVLLDACSRAAGGDGCVLGAPSPTAFPARALAVVWFDGAGDRHLRIDVASLGSPRGTFQARQLEFREEDLLPDRYRAAGLAVAALAAESELGDPRPPKDEKRPASRWALDAGGLVGGGVAGRSRAGAWSTVSVSSLGTGLLGSVSVSYATAVGPPVPGLSVQWVTVGAGGGIRAPIAPIHAFVRARIEGTADWALVTARDPAPKPPAGGPSTSASDSARVFNLGATTTLELVWPEDAPVSIVGGGSAYLGARSTTLRVHGQPAATLPMGDFTFTLGLEVRLP